MGDKGYFSRFVCTCPFWCWFPVSGGKDVLLFLVQRKHLSHGKFYDLLLCRKGEQRALPTAAVSQVPLAQNNQYAKAAYFEVACSEPLHMWRFIPAHSIPCN